MSFIYEMMVRVDSQCLDGFIFMSYPANVEVDNFMSVLQFNHLKHFCGI